jgi:broad specificity phosphatase PhoE
MTDENDQHSTFIDVLRHGQVVGKNYYQGITDDSLSELGWQQMQQRVSTFHHWDVIVSSPLQRCLNFAKILSKQRHRPLLINQGFQEMNFGDWEGQTAAQIEKQQRGSLMRFYQDPIQHPPPNSEPWLNFQQRVINSWQQLLQSQPGKHILIITHSGVIRTLFACLLNIPLKNSFAIQINHAALTGFQCFQNHSNFTQLNFHLSAE